MRRRGFIALAIAPLLGSLTMPLAAQPQGRLYRVGALFGGGDHAIDDYKSALAGRLATHGFEEGRNLRIDVLAIGSVSREVARAYARRLAAEGPDVLVTWGTFATDAARTAAGTIPIVFTWVADPVKAGFVASYAKPGGNLTGVSNRYGDMLLKRLELAIELVPGIRRIAIANTEPRLYPMLAPALQQAAARAGVELTEIPSGSGAWEAMIERAAREEAGAVIPHYQFAAYSRVNGQRVIARARDLRIPVVFVGSEMVEAGGLISYGTTLAADVGLGADQVARVLNGARPDELPVHLATRFELAVNLKTARAMGMVIPHSILLRADRMIE